MINTLRAIRRLDVFRNPPVWHYDPHTLMAMNPYDRDVHNHHGLPVKYIERPANKPGELGEPDIQAWDWDDPIERLCWPWDPVLLCRVFPSRIKFIQSVHPDFDPETYQRERQEGAAKRKYLELMYPKEVTDTLHAYVKRPEKARLPWGCIWSFVHLLVFCFAGVPALWLLVVGQLVDAVPFVAVLLVFGIVLAVRRVQGLVFVRAGTRPGRGLRELKWNRLLGLAYRSTFAERPARLSEASQHVVGWLRRWHADLGPLTEPQDMVAVSNYRSRACWKWRYHLISLGQQLWPAGIASWLRCGSEWSTWVLAASWIGCGLVPICPGFSFLLGSGVRTLIVVHAVSSYALAVGSFALWELHALTLVVLYAAVRTRMGVLVCQQAVFEPVRRLSAVYLVRYYRSMLSVGIRLIPGSLIMAGFAALTFWEPFFVFPSIFLGTMFVSGDGPVYDSRTICETNPEPEANVGRFIGTVYHHPWVALVWLVAFWLSFPMKSTVYEGGWFADFDPGRSEPLTVVRDLVGSFGLAFAELGLIAAFSSMVAYLKLRKLARRLNSEDGDVFLAETGYQSGLDY